MPLSSLSSCNSLVVSSDRPISQDWNGSSRECCTCNLPLYAALALAATPSVCNMTTLALSEVWVRQLFCWQLPLPQATIKGIKQVLCTGPICNSFMSQEFDSHTFFEKIYVPDGYSQLFSRALVHGFVNWVWPEGTVLNLTVQFRSYHLVTHFLHPWSDCPTGRWHLLENFTVGICTSHTPHHCICSWKGHLSFHCDKIWLIWCQENQFLRPPKCIHLISTSTACVTELLPTNKLLSLSDFSKRGWAFLMCLFMLSTFSCFKSRPHCIHCIPFDGRSFIK